MLRILLLSSLFAIGSAMPAQTCVYESSPDPAGNPAVQGTSIVGGIDFQRSQFIVNAAVFQNVPTLIREMSFGNSGGLFVQSITSLRVRFGYSTQTQVQPGFVQNTTSPLQDVLVATDYVWTVGLGSIWVPLGLQQPFLFVPGNGNLLVDIQTTGVTTTVVLPTNSLVGSGFNNVQVRGDAVSGVSVPGQITLAPRVRFCVDRAESMLLGQTCNGSAGSTPLLGVTGWPTPGATPTIWLSDAPPNAIAACAYGFSNAAPYPVNLTSLGAPGCRQYFAPAFADLVLANNLGIGQQTILVPSAAATIGAILYAQWWVLDPPANALDLTTSNYLRLLVGL
jgi:hypothetical protein